MTLYRELETRKAELEALSSQYYEQARQDPLTRLGNRLRLREDLEILDARAERYDHRYSVILCDVDHFKLYNDRYGHQAGDEVLRAVARALQGNARTGDTAYRYGGEEFLVVLPQQDLDAAVAAANRLRRVIEDLALPHEANPAGVVTVSMGVAAADLGERQRAESLLGEADTALYEAKQSGRNRVIAHMRTTT
jgi:diguanylate cyclase (GGDEF)-like protein